MVFPGTGGTRRHIVGSFKQKETTMQNIKTNGKKFLVEMKNDLGEYEPLGVLEFKQATELQFKTHRAVRMQAVSDLVEEAPDKPVYTPVTKPHDPVGCQLFTRGELNMAVHQLIDCIKGDNGYDGHLARYVLRNGYSTSDKRDLCENEWRNSGMEITFEQALYAIENADKVITEGNLEVYYNDQETGSAFPENHGIWITDGKITKIY